MLMIQVDDFKHGWCFLPFSDDTNHIEIDASSVLGDSMEKLVLSAIAALEGKSYSMSFFEEPGMMLLRMEYAEEALVLYIGGQTVYHQAIAICAANICIVR